MQDLLATIQPDMGFPAQIRSSIRWLVQLMTQSVVLYARFSPRPNAAECDSTVRQLDDLRAWASNQGWMIRSEHRDDALSGADADRPGVWDAIQAAHRGDLLAVRSFDRLARDTYLNAVIQHKAGLRGVNIVSMTEQSASEQGPAANLLRTILGAIAEFQRHMIQARTREAMRVHQAAGRRMSAICPFGWTRDAHRPGWMIHEPAEQALVATIRALRDEGWTVSQIKGWLNSNDCVIRGRQKWYFRTVAAIMRRLDEE